MARLQIDLMIRVETALSVGAGGSAGTLADKSVVRNRLGQLILPGSQLKGRLRHTCEMILRSQDLLVCEAPLAETMCPQYNEDWKQPCAACALFGSPAYPSRVRFSDLVWDPLPPGSTEDPWSDTALRPGVSINRRRRVAEENRLYLIETSPPGAQAEFHRARAIQGEVEPGQTELLMAGLALLYAWGGGKSRGLGWSRLRAVAQVAGKPEMVLDTTHPEAPVLLAGLEAIRQL